VPAIARVDLPDARSDLGGLSAVRVCLAGARGGRPAGAGSLAGRSRAGAVPAAAGELMRGGTWETLDTIAKRFTRKAAPMNQDRTIALTLPTAPPVTADHLALVRATIAKDATPAELELFLYDCARQGVHPLDKLIHFTKRAGKYTPITSIDFMRQRAADTGEYAGNDDPLFTGAVKSAAFEATATVYRLVQGQRYPFAATARWSEYKPDQDFMWLKMPHVMLGKCAEALALRKAFPKQLAGLYVKEEMEQATPAPVRAAQGHQTAPLAADLAALATPAPPAEDTPPVPLPEAWKEFALPPVEAGRIVDRIAKIDHETKKNRAGKVFMKTTVTLEGGGVVTTLDRDLATRCSVFMVNKFLAEITVKETRWGKDILTLAQVPEREVGADDDAF
jgi:phage recombination protein Bet